MTIIGVELDETV
jgi:hypothetical protein